MDHRIEVYRTNGVEHAWCNACRGEGAMHYGHTDPERDWSEKCVVCDGEGSWRLSPLDPLELVAQQRRWYRFGGHEALRYGEYLQRAVSPVTCLPADRVPAYAEPARRAA